MMSIIHQLLVSSSKELVATNHSSSLYKNVKARKINRKRKSYAKIVKEKISERKRRHAKRACY